ncbi:hypothetical protein EVAR_18246_1 [Eumeta japonica]|uniref:Uncharacterized protein n=1 Tax=Eumeta variegata TaxID=151549 RepID=A0A4C1UJV6_EUMVA|nr:hypothetical protein EVAR_18246_1 [Eumeta japonica]
MTTVVTKPAYRVKVQVPDLKGKDCGMAHLNDGLIEIRFRNYLYGRCKLSLTDRIAHLLPLKIITHVIKRSRAYPIATEKLGFSRTQSQKRAPPAPAVSPTNHLRARARDCFLVRNEQTFSGESMVG